MSGSDDYRPRIQCTSSEQEADLLSHAPDIDGVMKLADTFLIACSVVPIAI